jgi:uncharacterized protein (DUF1330 family)
MASFAKSVLRLEPPWYHKHQGDLRSAEGGVMLGKYKVALAMMGSFAFGAVAAQSLNAQPRPPAYVFAEVDVKDREKFETQFLPPAVKAVEESGGGYVVLGGKTVSLKGLPPQPRIVVMKFESMGKVQAWWNSPARKAADTIGEKYASFRVYAVEGTSQ